MNLRTNLNTQLSSKAEHLRLDRLCRSATSVSRRTKTTATASWSTRSAARRAPISRIRAAFRSSDTAASRWATFSRRSAVQHQSFHQWLERQYLPGARGSTSRAQRRLRLQRAQRTVRPAVQPGTVRRSVTRPRAAIWEQPRRNRHLHRRSWRDRDRRTMQGVRVQDVRRRPVLPQLRSCTTTGTGLNIPRRDDGQRRRCARRPRRRRLSRSTLGSYGEEVISYSIVCSSRAASVTTATARSVRASPASTIPKIGLSWLHVGRG